MGDCRKGCGFDVQSLLEEDRRNKLGLGIRGERKPRASMPKGAKDERSTGLTNGWWGVRIQGSFLKFKYSILIVVALGWLTELSATSGCATT